MFLLMLIHGDSAQHLTIVHNFPALDVHQSFADCSSIVNGANIPPRLLYEYLPPFPLFPLPLESGMVTWAVLTPEVNCQNECVFSCCLRSVCFNHCPLFEIKKSFRPSHMTVNPILLTVGPIPLSPTYYLHHATQPEWQQQFPSRRYVLCLALMCLLMNLTFPARQRTEPSVYNPNYLNMI